MSAARGARLIAIDGPSGTGKSTVARKVARALGAGYLDTGALYRIVTLNALQDGVDPTDVEAVIRSLAELDFSTPTDPDHQEQMLLGADVTERIRDADVTAAVSAVSAIPQVRSFLLDRQREIAYSGPMVVEGRDIGTVIAPDAAVKVYLTADADVRAARRLKQNAEQHLGSAGVDIAADLARRDTADSTRATSPLARAADAVVVDSTDLTIAQTVDAVLKVAQGVGMSAPSTGGSDHDADSASAEPAAGLVAGPAAGPAAEPAAGLVTASRPVTWFHLGGQDDPVPLGRTPRNVDRGRRIGIALSHLMYRMQVRGEEKMPVSGPLVVVANHTTFSDGPMLFGKLPRRVSFLVKAEVLVGPLGWLLRTVGQYAIDRAAPQRDVLMAALTHLKSGGALGIFPEGQRTDGSVSDVFQGAGWLAARAGATVVPVALRGTAKPVGRRFKRFRPRAYMLVGDPIVIPKGAGKAAINEATAEIQRHLSSLVADLDRGIAGVADSRARFGRGWRRA